MSVWALDVWGLLVPSKIFNPPFPVLKAGQSVFYSYVHVHITQFSKRLQKEYWYHELCPCGLNDSVGNVSNRVGDGLIVYRLFN